MGPGTSSWTGRVISTAQRCDGAYGAGYVLKLTFSGDNWTYTSLHDFHRRQRRGGPVERGIRRQWQSLRHGVRRRSVWLRRRLGDHAVTELLRPHCGWRPGGVRTVSNLALSHPAVP